MLLRGRSPSRITPGAAAERIYLLRRSLVPAPRRLASDRRLALDKYMPISAERSVGVRRGLKSSLQPLSILRIQLVMRGGIELESPERCNRPFGAGRGGLLIWGEAAPGAQKVEPQMNTDGHGWVATRWPGACSFRSLLGQAQQQFGDAAFQPVVRCVGGAAQFVGLPGQGQASSKPEPSPGQDLALRIRNAYEFRPGVAGEGQMLKAQG